MRKQAWEMLDDSYEGLEPEPASTAPDVYVTTLWENGVPTGIVATDEQYTAVRVVDPGDWSERMAIQSNNQER